MTASHRIDVGDVVAEKYRLVRAVAHGGMGSVFEAQHLVLERRVAIKVMGGGSSRRPQSVERFRREAKAAGSLESEHIAAVVDFGVTEGGTPFIVMEYVEGEDLSLLIERYQIVPVVRAVNLAIDVCLGLAVAHERGVVHRDLKPSNVIVTRRSDGTDLAKIVDFGVAKLASESTATEPGTLLGTALYMAPEQARDAPTVDHRADIYSVGVLLYEMMSGARPHEAQTPSAVVYHLLHEPAVPLAERRPDLPEELRAVVEKAMAFDAGDRYSSVRDLADALAPFAGERAQKLETKSATSNASASAPARRPVTATADSSEPMEMAATSTRPARRGGRATWLAIAALTALAMALGVRALSSSPPPSTVAQSSAPSASASPSTTSTSAIAAAPSAVAVRADEPPQRSPDATASATPRASASAMRAAPPPRAAPRPPIPETAAPTAAPTQATPAASTRGPRFDRANPYEHAP
jgi:serine/threonine-protein kinase